MSFSKKQFIYISVLIIANINFAYSIEPETRDNSPAYNVDSQSTISIYDSMYSAIEMDSYDEVKMFIKFGADINHRYEYGETPLMIASNIGSVNTVNILLELGADSKLKSNYAMTAMDYALKTNNKFIINALKTNTESRPIKSTLDTIYKNTNDIIIAEEIPIIH